MANDPRCVSIISIQLLHGQRQSKAPPSYRHSAVQPCQLFLDRISKATVELSFRLKIYHVLQLTAMNSMSRTAIRHDVKYHLISTLAYDTRHRLSYSVRLSAGISLSSSGLGVTGKLSAAGDVDELAFGELSACCVKEFNRCTFAVTRTVAGDTVARHFCSSAMWHCTACRNGR